MPKTNTVKMNYSEIDMSVTDRTDSEPVRRYNNCVKRYLMSKYCPRNTRILDVACGEGADIHKAHCNGLIYYGLDIDDNSIARAMKRLSNSPYDKSMFKFFSRDFTREFNLSMQFETIACNFAIHFAMMSVDGWKTFLSNIRRHCRSGTILIITCMNGQRIRNTVLNGPIEIKDDNGNLKFSISYAGCSEDNSAIECFRVHNSMRHPPGETELEGAVGHSFLVSSMETIGMELLEWSVFSNPMIMSKMERTMNRRVFENLLKDFDNDGWMSKLTRLNEFYIFRAN